jgi:predicted dehydrogenase
MEAIRRLKNAELVTVVTRSKSGADSQTIFADPSIDAVHICTPNSSHFALAKAALEAGKHVLCEKPLATSAAEAQALADLARLAGLRNCTCHNLRFYPMVQQARQTIKAGELGEILIAQGTYSQDWQLYDTDWNWRVDSTVGGPSRCMADIGSHWCDSIEHVTGLRITELCADLTTFHRTRRRPTSGLETFAGKIRRPGEYEIVSVDTEDFGAVLFHLGERARGCFTASQVSAGRKNSLRFEIFGTKGGLAWDGERPEELWIGHRDSPNQVLLKDPALLADLARPYAGLPGGHAEGYGDTFKQIFRRFYDSIEDPSLQPDYPQFSDGLRQLKVLEAVLASGRERRWVTVPGP